MNTFLKKFFLNIKIIFLPVSFKNIGLLDIIKIINTIKKIDNEIVGRYCGSKYDKIIQGVSVLDSAKKVLGANDVSHVEIGVLFGGGIILKGKILELNNLKQEVFGIDPLTGYYDKNRDPISGKSVDVLNLKKNLKIFNTMNVKILKGKSTLKKHIKCFKNNSIASLMIDGDHSYDGVKKDWKNFSPLVRKGGYVIFDDYKDPSWVDVTRFADELIKNQSGSWIKKTEIDTTLVLEKI